METFLAAVLPKDSAQTCPAFEPFFLMQIKHLDNFQLRWFSAWQPRHLGPTWLVPGPPKYGQ